jgi:phenylacetate-CoA ligase
MQRGLPASTAEIEAIQSRRKVVAVENARRSPFWRRRLEGVDVRKLDDPEEWRKIPILDKETLRGLSDRDFYDEFCLPPAGGDGVAEYWRSGGVTGAPLFYPRSVADIRYGMLAFARVYHCIGCAPGATAHVSFPLGIHPVGQMLARSAAEAGVGVNWAGSGTTTPSQLQLELIERLKPRIWLGMSSYGLHLANLAEARGLDLAQSAVETMICSAEPLSDAKRDKLGRVWGAQVFDTFGMTEAGMMGAEDTPGGGFRVWTDMYLIEVLDPETHRPVADGEIGALVVTPLWSHCLTPFLRWSSGDLVVRQTGETDGGGPFAVFPRLRHARRTAGFFKVRGINLSHAEVEDFMFGNPLIGDFKAEAVTVRDLDGLRLAIEVRRGADAAAVVERLVRDIKERFELTPEVVLLETGALAKEFEGSIKAPRFIDRRS